MSDEHFTVDGTLIEAWASHKSFRPKRRDRDASRSTGGDIDFRGEKRKNQTHESTTDPGCSVIHQVQRKPGEAELHGTYIDQKTVNGLLVQTFLTEATGRAEQDVSRAAHESKRSHRESV